MNLNDAPFVIGTVQSNSPNGPVAHHLNYNFENKNNDIFVEKNKYEESIKYKKQFIFYKTYNFEFKKALTLHFKTVSLHIGDIIDFITRHTGIKKLIIWLTKGNCGCEARRVKFNEWFKIKVPILKFRKLSYSDIIDIKRNENIKIQKNLFDEYKLFNENKSKKELEKQKIFEQLYNNPAGGSVNNDTKAPEPKKKGCGGGAKKQLTKKVNIV